MKHPLYVKIRRFSTYLNFDKKYFFGYFKSQISNDPNNVKKCHMFQVIEIVQARGISKYFLTGLKEHTVCYQCCKYSEPNASIQYPISKF